MDSTHSPKLSSILQSSTVADRCHATSRFRFPFSNFHFPLYTSIFHITTSIFHFPTSKADPMAFTGHLQAGCRPIMRSYGVCGIYRPGDQPTVHSVVIYRVNRGRPTVRSSIFQFPISKSDLAPFTSWVADRPCMRTVNA